MCGPLRKSMTRGVTVKLAIGHIRIKTCAGILHRMHLALLILLGNGFLLLVGFTGSKNHAKAQAECQKKAENALFHFHLHSSFRALWEFFKVIVSKKVPFVNTFSAFS